MAKSRKKSNHIRAHNIVRDSLFTEPAFKPKVARTGDKVKKYKRNKKVNLDE